VIRDSGDSEMATIHWVEVWPANIHDSHVLPWLQHGEERPVSGATRPMRGASVCSACRRQCFSTTERHAVGAKWPAAECQEGSALLAVVTRGRHGRRGQHQYRRRSARAIRAALGP
jgi:hypothetical protein